MTTEQTNLFGEQVAPKPTLKRTTSDRLLNQVCECGDIRRMHTNNQGKCHLCSSCIVFRFADPVVARDEAIDRSDQNANAEWREVAYSALCTVASREQDFTADDVWDELKGHDSTTHEPSALGPVFLRASKAKVIVKTGRQVLSRSSRRHRDLTVWRAINA